MSANQQALLGEAAAAAGGGGGTIALISHASGQTSDSSATTGSFDSTGANFIVVVFSHNAGASPAISDNKGNTYTLLTDRVNAACVRIAYCANATVGSGHTVTAALALSYSSVCAAAYSGVGTVAPADQENGNTADSGNTMTTGSVTPSQNNELLIAALNNNDNAGSGVPTISGGFTVLEHKFQVGGTAYAVAMADLIQTTAAVANPTWTWPSASTTKAAAIATFKAA